jgi:shikimate kinase
MLVLLVGPKGSGKSHIGRVLERRLGIHFFHVEPLWMDYHTECAAAGRAPSIAEGVNLIHPRIRQALAAHAHVCVETTGASAEIYDGLTSLVPEGEALVVRITAPLEVCLERIASRDQAHQIQLDIESIERVYDLSHRAAVDAALVLENCELSETEIVSSVAHALAVRSGESAGKAPGPGQRPGDCSGKAAGLERLPPKERG